MPLIPTPEELEAIRAAAVAALTSPTDMVRDGEQQVEMRGTRDAAETLGVLSELEDRANGNSIGLVVLCPRGVTL